MPPKKKKTFKDQNTSQDQGRKQLYFSDSNGDDSDGPKAPSKKSKQPAVKKQNATGIKKKGQTTIKKKAGQSNGIKVKNVKKKSKNKSSDESDDDDQGSENSSNDSGAPVKKHRFGPKGQIKEQYLAQESSDTSSLQQSSQSQQSKPEQKIRKWSDDKEEYIYYPQQMKTSKRGGFRPKKYDQQQDGQDGEGTMFDKMLIKKAQQYHQAILKDTDFNDNQQPTVDPSTGQLVKRQNVDSSRPTLIGPNMCHFPLESFRNRKFRDVAQLKMQLKKQEDQIKAKLNDSTIDVVFYRYFNENRKKTQNKQFISFKCEFPDCSAILKISNQKDGISIYLFRNKHNHTIKGDVLMQSQDLRAKPIYNIDLDPQLHRMFGLQKDFHHTNGQRSKKQRQRRQRQKQEKQKQKQDNSLAARRKRRMKRHHKSLSKVDYQSDLQQGDDNKIQEQQSDQVKSKVSKNTTKVKTESGLQTAPQKPLQKTSSQRKSAPSRSVQNQSQSQRDDTNNKPQIQFSKKQDDQQFEDIVYELERLRINVEFLDNIDGNLAEGDNGQQMVEGKKMKNKKEKLPSLIMMTNKKMIQNTKAYGHTVKLNIIEKMITLDKDKYKKQASWDLLLFSGINNSSTPIVLGLGLMLTIDQSFFSKDSSNPQKIAKTKQSCLQKLFKSFLRLSNVTGQINAIITPNSQLFKHGLASLKQKKFINAQTKHFIDQYEVMKQLKMKIKDYNSLKLFKKLFQCKSKSEADDQKAFLKHKNQSQALQLFQSYQKDITYYSIAQKLIGSQININSAAKLESIIKQRIKKTQRKTFRGNLMLLLQILTLMQKSSKQYIRHEPEFDIQKYFNDKYLIALRKKLGPKTLNKFLLEYTQASRIQKDYEKVFDGTYTFVVGKNKYIVGKDNICSCKYNQYIGLPCRHVIKVLKEEKKDYLSTINKRWIIDVRVEVIKQTQQKDKQNKDASSAPKRGAPTRSGKGGSAGTSRSRTKKSTGDSQNPQSSKVKQEAQE